MKNSVAGMCETVAGTGGATGNRYAIGGDDFATVGSWAIRFSSTRQLN